MSRIAMERNGYMQNGASRIPRFDHGRSTSNTNSFNHHQPLPSVGASQKPSKLQQMQLELQKNLLKEKEDKIITMYEENQKKALSKVNQNKGLVREFFNERRAGSGNSKHSTTPTIEQLYHQKKIENQISSPNGYTGNGGPPRNKSIPKYTNYNRGNDKRPSAGRDRANPLAPIQYNNNNDDTENPFAKRKAQIVRPRTYKGVQANRNYPDNKNVPKSAPNGFLADNNINSYEDEDSPLPSTRQFQHLQQKRKMLQDQRLSNKARAQPQNGHDTRKTTNRRNGQYEYETSEDDEGYEEVNMSENNSAESEMKKKQQELMAQIEAQQRELERLRNDRMNAEIQEKKEVERRKKLEEERRKKKIEDEKRRQKEEEEERIRQQWEEEKQHKIEMEKQRMRQVPQDSYDDDSSYGNNYYERQPSPSPEPQYYVEKKPSPAPPPQPRPANTRKVMPKKQPPKARSPSPLPTGDHTALYENADNLEGAYENVGRLKACFNCGRKFAEERLGKHEKSCKNITKKRKVLDPSKLRTKGTEQEQYQGHRKPTPPQVKKNNWRAKHENFQQAIRYAKKASQIEKGGGNLADLPPPPPTENPDYVQCPYCSRKFNEGAAERHIPHCKNTKARAKPPPQRRR